jgi:6-phosphogluconate dehydrogenase
MKIGFVGLGRMGGQMVSRLLDGRHDVVVYDNDHAAMRRARRMGALAALDHQDLIAQLGKKPIIWLMIPAQAVADELRALLLVLPAGSIVIDGGNSDFRQTLQRSGRCLEKGVELVDVGTSGGTLGINKGFSMPIGGAPAAVRIVEPIIKTLARPQGYGHFGPTGTGHYIKMVHNAIEYGTTEAYAEGYRLLKEGPFSGLNLAQVAEVWQKGSIIASTVNDLTGQILTEHPNLAHLEGSVAHSDDADWALQVAKGRSIELPVIQAAALVRKRSEQGESNFATKLVAALRYVFGGYKPR